MKRAGVIGHPVAHSLSPRIHGYWLERTKIKGRYDAIPVAPGELAQALKRLVRSGFAGVNVTLPHKEAVLALADRATPLARRMGAANTLVFRGGKILADNTDGYGFLENLKQQKPRLKFKGKNVAILGAGGAARGVCFALLAEGVTTFNIVNRDRERARRLAFDLLAAGADSVELFDWGQEKAFLKNAALLVNCTSLGMTGQPPIRIDLTFLPRAAVVYDIVYRPLMTGLLRQAQRRGFGIVTGLGMLLHQARPGFEAWFGKKVRVTPELVRRMEAAL